jgi:cytoskeletal protein CcmA (bactofilin family)
MAIFGREREGMEDGGTGVAAAPAPGTLFDRQRREDPAAAAGTSAFLGKGCRITGKVELDGVARIEGDVEGEVVASGTLIVGEGAVVKAKVSGAAIVVHGRVTGDLAARERLELRAPGAIVGNVTTPSLVVQEGAVLEGQCTMKGGAAKDRPAAPPAPARAAAGS